ncbi:MBL fold metallo-hydrolase [Alteribacter keqinensis]|uniref:MBL fold metallo-hydrolase n=1 Tax=Alteribacter keqinensis TaxID=2483800 RepID=A0A3M7TNU0_9BACI|nr:MBL fold metallo-hydrolase [Alteribacter keqinensis]RNA67058.1 MBL fold metallo-hydrolase [Alteribacter keqinensis]
MLVKTKEVAPSVYGITIPTPFLVGPVNVYIIEGERLTLVDTGVKTEEAKRVLEAELLELDYRFSDIELVILTHHHPDHIGLVEEFDHATIASHEKTKPWLEGDQRFFEQKNDFFRELYTAHGVDENIVALIEKSNAYYLKYTSRIGIDVTLSEGDRIEGLPGWSVIETPGHAQSQISLYRERDGVLISGDHLIAHISSNAIIEAPYKGETERPKTLLQYRDSLKKCLHVKRAFSGHGKPVEDPKALIEERLQKQIEKAKAIKNLLGEETLTSFELCKRLYPQMYTKQPGLTLSETLGHLDLLEEMNEVKAVNENSVYRYCKVD